jgi:hypothetical protein
MRIYQDNPGFQIALNAPICPQLLRDDAIVINEDGWYRTITPSSPWAADDNEILFSNLDKQDADGKIETIIGEYRKLGRPFRWCVYPWTQPAYLGERFLKRGATCSDVKALLCDTSLPLELVEGTEIEQVDPNSTEAYEAYIEFMSSGIMSSGRILPANEVAFRHRRYRELITGPKAIMQLFIARYDGVIAGCGAMYIKEDSAWLTGDYIASAFEGRGLFQSLIAARLRALRNMGIPIAVGHGREQTSVPWLERFGFKSIYSYRIYQFDPVVAG